MKIAWQIKHFEQLSTIELYEILQLRLAVFAVEQNCPYQDVDGKDVVAYHVIGKNEDNTLVAYARILPATVSYDEISIGRVATSLSIRNKGIGKQLMQKTLEFIEQQLGKTAIRISAQCYLINFYRAFGFAIDGEEYLEDNIPHIEMLRKS